MPKRPEGGWNYGRDAERQSDELDPREYFETQFDLSGEGTPEAPFSPIAGRNLPDILKALVGVCLNSQKLWAKVRLVNEECIFAINRDCKVFFLRSKAKDPRNGQDSDIKKTITNEAHRLLMARLSKPK